MQSGMGVSIRIIDITIDLAGTFRDDVTLKLCGALYYRVIFFIFGIQ